MLRNFTGSTGIRAAIAVLMLLFVVACSGSDSGIKRERDEARAAAEAAEQARLAAVEAAKKAAEEAAAQAEAARLAAEKAAAEAAAQAERDKQAALEAAEQAAIAERQMMAVAAAVTSAQEAVAALMGDSSDADVAGANAEIATATAAIAAATSFSEADKAMYNAQVASIQASLTLAQAEIRIHRAEAAAKKAEEDRLAAEEAARKVEVDRLAKIEEAKQAIAAASTATEAQAAKDAVDEIATAIEAVGLQAAVDARIAALATMDRASSQKMALMDAAGDVDTSDLMTQQDVDAAERAIAALKAALDAAVDVSDADKAMYQTQLEMAAAAVMTAQGTLDHAAQTKTLSDAVAALRAIDLSVLSNENAIDNAADAIAKLRMALEAATELSDAEKSVAMTELAAANRIVMAAQERVDTESQTMMLSDAVTALGMIDLNDLMTQAQIDAAESAITALDLALEAATNLTDAEKLDATVDVTLAKRKVTEAKEVLASNIGDQRLALTNAGTALREIDLDDLSDQAKIDAAENAVNALKMALDDATHLSAADKAMYQNQLDAATETVRTAQTGMDKEGRMTAQRTAIMDAVTMARTAVSGVKDDSTDAQVMAADNAITTLKAAIDGAKDLPEGDTEVAVAQGTHDTLVAQLASAKSSRTKAIAEDTKNRNDAMVVTAAMLYDGISAPMGDVTAPAATDRAAAYDSTDDSMIVVSAGVPSDTPAVVNLSEDKDTMVAALHGWEGKRYVDDAGGDSYEAIVYSNVGEPTEGAKFNDTENGGYALNADTGETAELSTLTGHATSRVASTAFDQSAGIKEFELGTNNVRVMITGSYQGVSGTYYCTPTGGGTDCSATVADKGFTLAGGTWTFKPTNPEARFMSMPDDSYASYGWWLYKSADGNTFTASAFAVERGASSEAATGIDALNGKATYMGGAAGKYALSSSTGGTNDAGHFTARATLEADFTNNTGDTAITGTIDQFMGADGQSRDWSVTLGGSSISDGGVIGDNDNDDGTTWKIGETAADASGEWTGSLRENGDDLVPEIATGTFYTEYGTGGKMVGAFGANKQ